MAFNKDLVLYLIPIMEWSQLVLIPIRNSHNLVESMSIQTLWWKEILKPIKFSDIHRKDQNNKFTQSFKDCIREVLTLKTNTLTQR